MNPFDSGSLREEIAHAAARLIAEEGADYEFALRKCIRQLGTKNLPPNQKPSYAEIEEALREYQSLFQSDEQPKRLLDLRHKTLLLMKKLAPFHPYVTGAVANGTASQHSDIRLQVFTDESKELALFLLNEHLFFESGELPHFRGKGSVEAISFIWQGELAVIEVYPPTDLRGALKCDADGRVHRLDAQTLANRMEQPE